MGVFDNANSVIINNKEVQSIITSNGGVIYEKPIGYELVLSSNKSIIQSGESTTLSATLTENNVPMEEETIFFSDTNIPPTTSNTSGYEAFNVHLGASFKVYYNPVDHGQATFYLLQNQERSLTIRHYADGKVSVSFNGHTPETIFSTNTFLKLENGILSDGEGHTYDFSSYDNDFGFYAIFDRGTVYFAEKFGLSEVTDANGVASVTYVGEGVGDIDVRANWENTLQSNTLTLEDCYFYRQTVNSEYNGSMDTNINIPYTNHFKIEFDFIVTDMDYNFDTGLYVSNYGIGADISNYYDELYLCHNDTDTETIQLILNTNYHLVYELDEEDITVYLNNQEVWSEIVDIHYNYDTLFITSKDNLLPLSNFKIINIE